MNIIIIDDEKKARKAIKNILNLSGKKCDILAEADCVKNGLEVLQIYKPDILFLDIEMPDGTGFDLLEQLKSINFRIIFVTAHEEYAIKAFKYSALDYILKPVSPRELIAAIEKAENNVEIENFDLQYNSFLSNAKIKDDTLKKLVLKTAESIHIVNICDIIRCEADGGYTKFYIEDGRTIMVSKNLKEYHDLLIDFNFFRTHHSHLVNLKYVISYEKREGGYLVMKDKTSVPVSTRKKDELIKYLSKM